MCLGHWFIHDPSGLKLVRVVRLVKHEDCRFTVHEVCDMFGIGKSSVQKDSVNSFNDFFGLHLFRNV